MKSLLKRGPKMGWLGLTSLGAVVCLAACTGSIRSNSVRDCEYQAVSKINDLRAEAKRIMSFEPSTTYGSKSWCEDRSGNPNVYANTRGLDREGIFNRMVALGWQRINVEYFVSPDGKYGVHVYNAGDPPGFLIVLHPDWGSGARAGQDRAGSGKLQQGPGTVRLTA